jgi:cytochrome c553
MTRLLVFLSVLTGFVLVLALFTFKSLPVDNAKFNFEKSKEEFVAHTEAVHKAIEASHGEVKKDEEAAPTEVVIKIDLNTPQLVSGDKIFSKCIACHGKDGAGKAAQKAPHIGGQYDWYILKQLTDMKSGARVNEAMMPTLKGLSDQDMKDVAAYVTKLPWKKEVAAATSEKK